MPGLTEALVEAAKALSPCPVVTIRSTLDPADRAAFDEAIADAAVPSVQVSYALGQLGVLLADSDIHRHRGADCPCIMKGA